THPIGRIRAAESAECLANPAQCPSAIAPYFATNRPAPAAGTPSAPSAHAADSGFAETRSLSLYLAEEEVLHECFLRMYAVFSIVLLHRERAIDDLSRDFLAAEGRQAVHEQSVGPGHGHHVGIREPVGEGLHALLV